MYLVSVTALLASASSGMCPFLAGGSGGAMPPHHPPVPHQPVAPEGYREALDAINFDDVEQDLMELFTTSSEEWPADYGNYGPLMIRLAWHAAGSYRMSDGRGGADGGRQRFDEERSWDDNTNLDKARNLLKPIKEKYGTGLSWGDLIVFAGDVAIKSMGGPIVGFCAGRVDDDDGFWSVELGPTDLQDQRHPCEVQGDCKSPLGATTVGLIYVNPEGPQANPVPELSAPEVRDTFGRMGMDDEETVALVGGGHAFGKTHGACPDGPGLSPKEDEENPWPGNCGTGRGADTFTSGFEGAWTTNPTYWDNEYYKNLVNYEWYKYVGPGGKHQWGVAGDDPPDAPGAAGGRQNIIMLTADLSLMADPENKYQSIVRKFAEDQDALDVAFSEAWYKLMTRDMGPVTRCLGKRVPEARPFQFPLPDAPAELANFDDVKEAVVNLLTDDNSAGFARLAYQCASTFRTTDYRGGCNGGRIRFPPQSQWSSTVGLDVPLADLAPIKEQFGEGLSWADLIVLAGTAALERGTGGSYSFCGGRTDANDGLANEGLEPWVTGADGETLDHLLQANLLMGISKKQMVALMGANTLGIMRVSSAGVMGNSGSVSNAYFVNLLNETWEPQEEGASGPGFKAFGKELYASNTELFLLEDDEYRAIVESYAADNQQFMDDLTEAWTKLMNIDRFDGPAGNMCDCAKEDEPDKPDSEFPKTVSVTQTFTAGSALALVTGVIEQFPIEVEAQAGPPGYNAVLNIKISTNIMGIWAIRGVLDADAPTIASGEMGGPEIMVVDGTSCGADANFCEQTFNLEVRASAQNPCSLAGNFIVDFFLKCADGSEDAECGIDDFAATANTESNAYFVVDFTVPHQDFCPGSAKPAGDCENITKKGQCKKVGTCEWGGRKVKCVAAPDSDDPCLTHLTKKTCKRSDDECKWRRKKCVAS